MKSMYVLDTTETNKEGIPYVMGRTEKIGFQFITDKRAPTAPSGKTPVVGVIRVSLCLPQPPDGEDLYSTVCLFNLTDQGSEIRNLNSPEGTKIKVEVYDNVYNYRIKCLIVPMFDQDNPKSARQNDPAYMRID